MDVTEIQSFDLPSVVDLDAMDELREWLNSALEIGDIHLNAAGVTRLATNALLMLASARSTAGKNKISLLITHPSEAFGEAVSRLGMDEIMAPLLEGN